MSKLDEAIAFAALAHEGQTRKYSTLPYIVHPIEVMQIVYSVLPDDEDALIAAVCHDVVEDTTVGLSTIIRRFGERAGVLVLELTEPKLTGNRRERKAWEVQRLAEISDVGQTIKLADLISNTASIVEHDPDFAVTYLREKEACLAVLTRGDRRLREQAQAALVRGQEMLVQHNLGKKP